MRNASTLGFTGRYDRLAPVVEESFDLAFIASVVTGRHWDSLDGAQRERMIDTFTRLTIATYAARFDDFSGEAFEVAGVKRMKSDRMLVRTELREGDGEVIQLDYLLHDAGGEWKIVNVIADGVSDLSIKRAEYSSVIADSGFDALISRLNEQIEDYADS